MSVDLNANSFSRHHLIAAAQYQYNHNYPQAVNSYIQALKDPALPLLTQMLIDSNIAILYIQIHDYAHAHRILTDLSMKLATNQTGNVLQQALLSIKIQASLALIELANLNTQHVYSHIDTVLSRVSNWDHPGPDAAENTKILFQSAMKILFGFQTFAALASDVQLKLNLYEGQLAGKQILILSLAINRQISGDIEAAYQLSYKVYEYCRNNSQVIPMTIACKHLLHLSQKLSLSKTIIQVYRSELNRLMATPELYGISGQTLFRNFEQKIQCGVGIAQIMSDFEQKLNENVAKSRNKRNVQDSDYWLRKNILLKLHEHVQNLSCNMGNKQNNLGKSNPYISNIYQQNPDSSSVQKQINLITQVINSLTTNKSSQNILKFMKDSEMVKQVHRDQTNKLIKFGTLIRKYGFGQAWKEFVMLPPKIVEQWTSQKYEDTYQKQNRPQIYRKGKQENKPNHVSKRQNIQINNTKQQLNRNTMGYQKQNYDEQMEEQKQFNQLITNNFIGSESRTKIFGAGMNNSRKNHQYPAKHTLPKVQQKQPRGQQKLDVKKQRNLSHLALQTPYEQMTEKSDRSQHTTNPQKSPIRKGARREYANVIDRSPQGTPRSKKNTIFMNPKQQNQNNSRQYSHLNAFINPGNQVYMENNSKLQKSYLEQIMVEEKPSKKDKKEQDVKIDRKTAHFPEQPNQSQYNTQKISNNNKKTQSRMENSRPPKQSSVEKDQNYQQFNKFNSKFSKHQENTNKNKRPKQVPEGSDGQQMTESRVLNMVISDTRYKKHEVKHEVREKEKLQRDIEDANISEIPHIPHNKIQSNINVIIPPEEKMQSRHKQSSKIKHTSSQMLSHSHYKNNVSSKHRQHHHDRVKKFLKFCQTGQYFIKRHFSSDGGEEKYVQLTDKLIKWAVDQDKINTRYQQYKLKDVKGIAYGKVSETFLKDCNKKLAPERCFSLILQKRTLDFFCTADIDPIIWLSGITASIEGQIIPLKNKKTKAIENVPTSLYSPGRALWKRFLLRLQSKYVPTFKKDQRNRKFKNANAYAIIMAHRHIENSSKYIDRSMGKSKSKSKSRTKIK